MASSAAPNSTRRETRRPKGRIITFYSYKGGTGRSMAVANVAWMLALNGERVLIIDWDLEAPGIHRYFHPFMDDKELTATEGLLDFVVQLAGRAAVSKEPLAAEEVDVIEYITILKWPSGCSTQWHKFGPFAGIDLLVAGRQGPAYGQKLNNFNWIDFYQKLGGRRLLNIMRQQLQGVYDYVLIDSRTGVSDTSGICTVEMPDSLVVCFTLNDQSIKGASGVLESILLQRKSNLEAKPQPQPAAESSATSYLAGAQQALLEIATLISQSAKGETLSLVTERPFRIFPVPTRVEIVSERIKREVALDFARQRFFSFTDHLSPEVRGKYWGSVQLPYFPFYAFEEIPAVFGDVAGDQLSLSTPLRYIARYISEDPNLKIVALDADYEEAERLRKQALSWYVRKGDILPKDVIQLAQITYDNLDPSGQLLMKKVMLRLVEVVAGSIPSLATVPLDEFDPPSNAMIQMLAGVGLIQISGTSVFLADRRLVAAWDPLQGWLKKDADFLLWRQRLNGALRAWRGYSSDESALPSGPFLKESSEWLEKRRDDLTEAESAFIVAGQRAQEKRSPTLPRSTYVTALWGVVLVSGVVLGMAFLVYSNNQKTAQLRRLESAITENPALQARLKNSEINAPANAAPNANSQAPAPTKLNQAGTSASTQVCKIANTGNLSRPSVVSMAIDGQSIGKIEVKDQSNQVLTFPCEPGEHRFTFQISQGNDTYTCSEGFRVEGPMSYKALIDINDGRITCRLIGQVGY